MTLKRSTAWIVACCAVLVVSAMPRLAGQMPLWPQQAAAAKPHPALDAKCQALMADHEKMMADMKLADQRIADLTARMNAASGTAKTDAVAAVVMEMVAQHQAMRDAMMKMHDETTAHMMEHVQAGRDSLAMCPMTKQMTGTKH